MDLNQLYQFITVAKTENITKASHKLYITQPALSRSISRLEAELEVKLFDRKSNTLILNENGQIFLQYVSAGLDSINAGVHAVRQRNVNRQVLVSNYVFLDDFASFCDRCLSAFPDVDLQAFDGTRSVSDFPTDLAADLTIIPEKDFRNYIVAKVYLEPWCIMFHKNYTFRSDCDGTAITPEQLYQESIIFDSSPYDKGILSQLFPDLPPNLRFATRSDESRISISRSKAIGIAPVAAYRSLVRRVSDTPVRALLLSGQKMERNIYLSHRPNFLNNAEDYAILELLDQHITEELQATEAFLRSGFQRP